MNFSQVLKIVLKEFITLAEFRKWEHEPETLFQIFERLAVYDSVNYVTEAGMCSSSILGDNQSYQ